MKNILKLFFVVTILIITSCTQNTRARQFGGTETILLEPNEIFINATWRNSNLWVITKDTVTNDFYLREKSNYGVMEGRIIFKNK